MKKTILILSVISIVIAAVSMLLLISFLTAFWEPMCILFSAPQGIVEAGPIIPDGTMVYMVGCLLVTVAIGVFAKSNRAIVFEIIAIVLLSVVIPILVRRLSMTQTLVIGQTMGDAKPASLNVANQIGSFASRLMAVSEALCLVVCGMSITEKVIKKAVSHANQTIE